MVFIIASSFQNDCHGYLALLKIQNMNAEESEPEDEAEIVHDDTEAPAEANQEYQLPEYEPFKLCLTPHYLAECVIYLALAFQAAPSGDWLNRTLTCALVFVVVNLGITAQETKNWYQQKFGPDAVKGKARMIPYVY